MKCASARCAGEQQAAAGVGIEPVHRRRRPFETAAQFAELRCNRIPAPARRIDRQAGGLVEHDRLGVDVKDAIGEVHRCVIARSEATKQSRDRGEAGLLRSARNDGLPVDTFVTPLQRNQGIHAVTQY